MCKTKRDFYFHKTHTMSKEFWNTRYKNNGYAYGKTPNLFFKNELSKHKTGTILLPLEGEGRNANFAASLGWDVFAFDISEEGKQKALRLTEANDRQIHYDIEDIQNINYPLEKFDAIGLVFAHFPINNRQVFHRKLLSFLKPGGILILEGYSKKHHKYNSVDTKVGGPDNPEMLFSKEDLLEDFNTLDILSLEETDVILNEGLYHNGKSAVIRIVGRKK